MDETIAIETKEEMELLVEARNKLKVKWSAMSTKERINFDNAVLLGIRAGK